MNTSAEWPNNPAPIVLLGPTGVGKTDAAMALARLVGGEIVSADSMQVYRGMDIGTAKPSAADRATIPFHLLDLRNVDQPFSVADWKAEAEAAICAISGRGRVAIVCGGTGLYIRALLQDWSFAETASDDTVKRRLQQEISDLGAPALHARLSRVDPMTGGRLHPNDVFRVIRALEVWELTGRPLSEPHSRDRMRASERPARLLGLTLPREALYARIGHRVDRMLASGWVEEVRTLLRAGYHGGLTPLKGLGYKEIIRVISGQCDHAAAVETIKQNTRRFAKRQQTWFRGDSGVTWIDVSDLSSAEVATRLLAQLSKTAG